MYSSIYISPSDIPRPSLDIVDLVHNRLSNNSLVDIIGVGSTLSIRG